MTELSEKERWYLEQAWKEVCSDADEETNPLRGQVGRVYFVSRSQGKGRKPRERWREITLVKLPNGCRTIKDSPTGRLDSIAEEFFPIDTVPPDTTPFEYFLRWFNQLTSKDKPYWEQSKKKRKKKKA